MLFFGVTGRWQSLQARDSCLSFPESSAWTGSRVVAGVGLEPAANAGVDLIVGLHWYLAAESKETYAPSLLSGVKSTNGRGADVVLSHFDDLFDAAAVPTSASDRSFWAGASFRFPAGRRLDIPQWASKRMWQTAPLFLVTMYVGGRCGPCELLASPHTVLDHCVLRL